MFTFIFSSKFILACILLHYLDHPPATCCIPDLLELQFSKFSATMTTYFGSCSPITFGGHQIEKQWYSFYQFMLNSHWWLIWVFSLPLQYFMMYNVTFANIIKYCIAFELIKHFALERVFLRYYNNAVVNNIFHVFSFTFFLVFFLFRTPVVIHILRIIKLLSHWKITIQGFFSLNCQFSGSRFPPLKFSIIIFSIISMFADMTLMKDQGTHIMLWYISLKASFF